MLAEITNISATSFPSWSTDYARVAWLQADGTVTVVNAGDGKNLSTWGTGGQGALAFRDAEVLAVQTFSGNLQLYHAASGKPLGQPARSSASAFAIVPSPDGTSLLTCGWDGDSTLWHGEDLTPLCEVPGRWFSGSFAKHGALLAMMGEVENEVLLFDMNRLRPARPPIPVPGKPSMAVLSADGRLLASGGRQRRLTVYDLQSRAARPEVLPLHSHAWHAGWDQEGSTLTVLFSDDTAMQWDAEGKLVAQQKAEAASSLMPRAAPERLTDAFQKAIPARLLGGVGPDTIRFAALAPDGQYLAFADNGKLLHLKPLTALAGPQSSELGLSRSIHGLVFSPDGKLLAASLTDGTVLQLEVPSLRELKRWQPRTGPSRVLAFFPDGRLASGGEEGSLAISPGPAVSGSSGDPIRQMKITPDGRFVVTGNSVDSASIWDTATGKLSGTPLRHKSIAHHGIGVLLSISPDGSLLATSGCHDGAARLWEIPGGKERGELYHKGLVDIMAFDPSGRRLLTLCSPGNAGILSCWSTTTALPVMAPQTVPDGMVGRMLIPHPAGTLAGVVTESGTIFLYDLPPMVSAAPAWLADAAEAWTGWHFGPTGLPAPTGNLEPVIPTESAATPTAAWGQWLAAAPKDRTASPHGSQKISDYLAALTTVDTGKVWEEINHLQPVPGGIPAIRAVELALQRSPASAALATKLAWQALRLGGHDEGTVSYAAFALSLASGEAAAGRLLLQRVKDHPENPDTWDNAAAWLKREQAWVPAWLCFHRAAQAFQQKGDHAGAAFGCPS